MGSIGNETSAGTSTNGNGSSEKFDEWTEPLVIVGMASRFPQEGDNNENFWNLLMEGRSAMTPFPKEKIDMDGHYHPDPEHGGTVRFWNFVTLDAHLQNLINVLLVSRQRGAFHERRLCRF